MRRYGTFADILAANRFSDYKSGECRFCHEYGKETAYYATRHVVCRDCCKKRGNEVLPSVLKAQGKARSYVKKYPESQEKDVRFIHYMTGATEEFIRSEIDKAHDAPEPTSKRAATVRS